MPVGEMLDACVPAELTLFVTVAEVVIVAVGEDVPVFDNVRVYEAVTVRVLVIDEVGVLDVDGVAAGLAEAVAAGELLPKKLFPYATVGMASTAVGTVPFSRLSLSISVLKISEKAEGTAVSQPQTTNWAYCKAD